MDFGGGVEKSFPYPGTFESYLTAESPRPQEQGEFESAALGGREQKEGESRRLEWEKCLEEERLH